MKRTILIVEDTDDCRDMLELTLSRIGGVIVRAVASAEEALLHAACGDVCALVTDLGLPRMSGFDLIQSVRSQGVYSKLPVFVVSGQCGEDARARVAALGANAFFSKPFSPVEVRDRVQQMIGEST